MPKSTRKLEAFKHQNTTLNGPTEEMMRTDEPVPQRASPPSDRGPREPQLWWRSKEPESGWVASAPVIHTAEKVHPQAYVEKLTKGAVREGDLFYEGFNGLDDSLKWEVFQHQASWTNRLIRGESSQIMASLLEHEDMAGKVQMVYYDPPYGIGYDSNFQQLTGKPGARKSKIQADVETVKAFRDRYQDNLHSYMDSLHRNLVLVRELLAEGGHCFVQMGSDNVHEVAMVAQHVFGKENRICTISYATTTNATTTMTADVCNYLVWFAKDRNAAEGTFNPVHEEASIKRWVEGRGSHIQIEEPDGTTRPFTKEERANPELIPEGCRVFEEMRLSSPGKSETRSGKYWFEGKEYQPTPSGESAHWAVSPDGMDRLKDLGRLYGPGSELSYKRYADERPGRQINNVWANQMSEKNKIYTVQTATETIERCMLMTTQPGDLVLDITCGSGTTALVAERWGRRWITTDTSAVPIALARQRLAVAVHPYQVLQDSAEGAKRERELGGNPLPGPDYGQDVRKGFVYKRSKKVTAAILAYDQEPETVLLVNEPEIDKTKLRPSSPFCVQNANATAYLPLSDRYDDRMPNKGGGGGLRVADDAYAD